MFFGFLGLINGIVFFPVLVILSLSHAEPFSFPNKMVLLYLSVNAFIGTVLSDFIWLWSVLLTTPLIATLGLSLTTVLAMLVDFFARHKDFSFLYLIGAMLVLTGFFIVNTDQFITSWIVRLWKKRFGRS